MDKAAEFVFALLFVGAALLIMFRYHPGFSRDATKPRVTGKGNAKGSTSKAVLAVTALFTTQLILIVYSGHHRAVEIWETAVSMSTMILYPLIVCWHAKKQALKQTDSVVSH